MLEAVRTFFYQRQCFEVDVSILKPFADIDTYIEPICVGKQFLHTSPEYEMKKLLAKYKKDIFYLGHVFRKEEEGKKHKTEFTMIEWYRIGFSFEAMIQEILALIQLFTKEKHVNLLTYKQVFEMFVKIDPFTVTKQELLKKLHTFSIEKSETLTKDDLLNLCFSFLIEPKLSDITIVYDYPATQAALSQIEGNIAKRFEIFVDQFEIANGYKELLDPKEQKKRFLGYKKSYALDEAFLDALSNIPECCGVAVGFDRLMMLLAHANHIQDIYP